jgi:hypothetical protein
MQPNAGIIDWTAVAAFIGVFVAAVGYFVKHWSDLRMQQRNDRLQRINRQLTEFCGPLLAHTRSSDKIWRAFRRRHRPGDQSFWTNDLPLTEADVMAWRLWMSTVFLPLNQRMSDLVHHHADLIDESEMPACLLVLCAHVAGYQAIIKEWEADEISLAREDNISVVNFPGQELAEYAATAFERLKREQSKNLGS